MFYTVKEVSQLLKISLSMTYALIAHSKRKTCDLPCHTIGTCKRISQEDLENYLQLQRQEQQPKPVSKKVHF